MICLWRISNHTDLTGLGGERASGRWHTAARGKRIVYLAEHPALCLIETVVHLKGSLGLLPDQYTLIRVELEEDVFARAQALVEESEATLTLPEATSRQLGNQWLAQGASALARVPSFPSPFSNNYLLNPNHADASNVRVAGVHRIHYDPRLMSVVPTR